MLTAIIVVVQILASLALIFLVLMHSGKGGGLSDMFGGSVGSTAAGSTVVEKNLDRITITVAVVFAFSNLCLILRVKCRGRTPARPDAGTAPWEHRPTPGGPFPSSSCWSS